MDMGERIKERRKAMNLTQEELAQKLGLQKSAIAKYENGRVENIKRSIIAKMAETLECSPSYLMGWELDDQSINRLSEYYLRLCDIEKELLAKYHTLNAKGKLKLIETAREMVCNPLYNANYELEVIATHERTDIETTDDMIKHDDDIMNEDNF